MLYDGAAATARSAHSYVPSAGQLMPMNELLFLPPPFSRLASPAHSSIISSRKGDGTKQFLHMRPKSTP